MRRITTLLILLPFIGFSQKKTKDQPANCIQIDSNTFFGQTEITNRMYREFVDDVRDSIATHLLYSGLPFERAKQFLNAPKKVLKQLTEDKRGEYLQQYGLDWSGLPGLFELDSLESAIISPLLYPQPERFYRKKEFDGRQIIYLLPSGKRVPIYPDTTSWLIDYHKIYPVDSGYYSSWAVYYSNMNFWHPADDNYPVVGLNLEQMKAYCEWFMRQLNDKSGNSSLHYSVSIPIIEDYEKALKHCSPEFMASEISSQNLINPIVYKRGSDDAAAHIHVVYKSSAEARWLEPLSIYKLKQWARANTTFPILNLLSGPAEASISTKSKDEITILGGDYYLGIIDPNGIQANTLFYERQLPKDKGYSYVGFRIIVKTKHN